VISVKADPRIAGAVLAWRQADREIRKIVRADTAREFRPVWRAEISRLAAADPRGDTLSELLRTGVTFAGGNPPEARAFTTVRKIRGGASPAGTGPQLEFGAANPEIRTRYRRTSPKGKAHTVTRRASIQAGRRLKRGRTVYPTVAEIAPRVISYWASAILGAYSDPEAVVNG
jgi:hypothetical protein